MLNIRAVWPLAKGDYLIASEVWLYVLLESQALAPGDQAQ